jgi:dTDP-glucose pyrophosphorylase
MIKPTLLVLAAGMGSRYGGLKQLDGVGPNGETIMDYSIFDAIRAGFGKVVYVIRHDFEEEFKKHIISKYKDHIKVETVFQSKDILPSGYTCPLTREKPWGTNHAVLMGKSVINEPFAVINADDFYGRYSYTVLAEELVKMAGSNNKYCMVGYRVGNTLSEGGTVARGVCEVDKDKYLIGVTERTKIMRVNGNVSYKDEDDNWVAIDDNTPVSMNMWGFTPDYFDYSESDFVDFLKNNINNPKTEFYIPTVVNKLVENKTASVKVLDTTSKWFGVTYATDKEGVVKNISNLIKAGEYPTKLW